MAYELYGDVQGEVTVNTESTFEPAGDGGSFGPDVSPSAQDASVKRNTYRYCCSHCAGEFSTMKDLKEHAKKRHEACLSWLCANCDADDFEYFQHFVTHIQERKVVSSQYCPYFDRNLDDPSHTGRNDEKFCGYCGEINSGSTKSGQQAVKAEIEEIEETSFRPQRILEYGNEEITCWTRYPYVCSYCNTKFVSRWALRCHLRKTHEKCFGLVCVDCLQEQKTFMQFVEHVRKHRPVLGNYCEYCDKLLADENQYFTHFAEVHKQDYKCNKCGDYFKEESSLNRHKVKFIDMSDDFDCVNRRGDTVTRKPKLACDICGKTYVSRYHLAMHRTSHDKGSCSYKRIFCNYCGKNFAQKNMLIVHIANKHDKNIGGYNCQFCKKKFYVKTLLQMHVDKVHLAHNYECAECYDRFRTLRDLKRHMFIWHENNNFYPCDYCPMSYKRESCLKKHEINHIGQITFTCSECKINFDSFNCYRQHCRNKHRYRDLRSNFCASCNINYGFPSNYRQHLLSGKCRSRRKPNRCPICFIDIVYPDNYENHVATMHSDISEPSVSNLSTVEAASSASLRPEQTFPLIDQSILPHMDPDVHGIPSLNTLATNAVTQNVNIDTDDSNPDTNEIMAENSVTLDETVSNAMNPQEYFIIRQDNIISPIKVDDQNVNANTTLQDPAVLTGASNTNSNILFLDPETETINMDIDTTPTQEITPSAKESTQQYKDLTNPMMTVMSTDLDTDELLADVYINQNNPNANKTASEWLDQDPEIDKPPGSDLIFDENILMPEFDLNTLLDFDETEINTATPQPDEVHLARSQLDEVPLDNIPEINEELDFDTDESAPEMSDIIDEATDDSNSSYSSSTDSFVKKEMARDLNCNILFGEVDNNEP